MTSYPKKVDKFIPWTKAMVAGATVDKPSYPGTSKKLALKMRKRRRRRKKRKQRAKET